jgi:alpha-L-fucosidase
LYVHCTKFPTSQIEVKGVKGASKVNLLGYDGKVKISKSGNTLKIAAPQLNPITNPNEHAWVFKIENAL